MRVGSYVRLVRHRLGWRQVDVAARAGVSQDTVSRVERGQLASLQVRTVRDVLRALEMDLALVARWRGGDLDRLADEGHAALVGRISAVLIRHGWTVMPEVSYAHYGERGSIDVLAWHAATRTLLAVEVKTALNSVEETVRRHDAKVRLAPMIAAERFGWTGGTAVPLLILPEHTTARRRVAAVDAILARRYPMRGRAAFAWIRAPRRIGGLLMFLSLARHGRHRRSPIPRKRVRRVRGDRAGTKDAREAQKTGSQAADSPRTPPERR